MLNLNQKRFSKTITTKIRPCDPFACSSTSWKEIAKAILLTLCFSLFNNQLVVAQDPHESGGDGPNEIIPIQAGQRLPESMWEVPLNVVRHPQGKDRVSLNDFRGKKLIILDFWATWCSPCVAMIPKNVALKKKFEKDLEVIMLTDQPKDLVSPFLERVEQQEKLPQKVWTAYGKHDFHQIFKYMAMPHAAIIYDGVYKGAVFGNEITEEKIEMMLEGKWGQIAFKRPEVSAEHKYDKDRLLYIDGNGGGQEFISYRSVLGGYNPSLGSGKGYIANTQDGGRRLAILNMSLPNFYQFAYGEGRTTFYPLNRKILEVADSSRLVSGGKTGDAALEWMRSGNAFCYELMVPGKLAGSFYRLMQEDLDRLFPQYKAGVEQRDVECYVLKVTDPRELLKYRSSSGKMEVKQDVYGLSMKHAPLRQLVDRLSILFMQHSPYPIIDESGYVHPLDLEIHGSLSDMGQLNSILAKYGLQFFKESKKIEMLVIKESRHESER